MDAARELFDSVKTLPGLKKAIDEKLREGIHLDYIAYQSEKDKRDDEFKFDNIAKPVCGFANSNGGVIVYGVTCCDDKDQGRDLPEEMQALPTKGSFRDSITATARDKIAPPITDLDIEQVRDLSNGAEATVVYVPQSRVKPHQVRMAVQGKKAQHVGYYYYRTDDDTPLMDPSLIEMHYKARHAQELGVAPLLCLEESAPGVFTSGAAKVTVLNRGNAAAINVRISFGPLPVGRRGVLGAAQPWGIDNQGDPEQKDAWNKRFLPFWKEARPSERLVIEYADIAGVAYSSVVPCIRVDKREQYVTQTTIEIHRDGRRLA